MNPLYLIAIVSFISIIPRFFGVQSYYYTLAIILVGVTALIRLHLI